MALSPHALTTLARVKAVLLNLEGTAEEDTEIETLINDVTGLFEAVADRRLKSRVYKPSGAGVGEENILLSGNDLISPTEIFVPEWPLTDVSAITIRSSAYDSANETVLVSGEDWTFTAPGKITLIDGDIFLKGVNNILVTFTAGYLATHRLFPPLEKSCIDQVRYEWQKRKNTQDMVTSISDPGGSVNYFQGPLLPQVRMLLENTYQRQEL